MFCSNILVAYDGSVSSEKALLKASQVAKTDQNIGIYVLYAFKPMLTDGTLVDTNWLDENIEVGKEMNEKVKKVLGDIPNPHSVSITMGIPEEEILKYAQENQCDLIVMGNRGLTGLKKFILGSVSHYVVQHAEVPVLIVK